jgi:hypothetical protein
VRTERYKYIRRYDGRDTAVLSNQDDGISKTLLAPHMGAAQPLSEESLFDLMFDPCERHDRSRDPAMHGTMREMRQRLDDWMRRTNDPLLTGPLPRPAESRITSSDAYSPSGDPAVGPSHALVAPPLPSRAV